MNHERKCKKEETKQFFKQCLKKKSNRIASLLKFEVYFFSKIYVNLQCFKSSYAFNCLCITFSVFGYKFFKKKEAGHILSFDSES